MRPTLWASALASGAVRRKPAGYTHTRYHADLDCSLGIRAWLVATNTIATSSYTAAAPFHAAFLAGGFALGRRLDAEARNRRTLFAVGGAGLALWALCQLASGATSRGHAHFETPNTLATVREPGAHPEAADVRLNRAAKFAMLGSILAVIPAATLSRGGFLGLAGGLLAASMLARRSSGCRSSGAAQVESRPRSLGWSIAELAPFIAHWLWVAQGPLGQPGTLAAQEMFGEVSKYSSRRRGSSCMRSQHPGWQAISGSESATSASTRYSRPAGLRCRPTVLTT